MNPPIVSTPRVLLKPRKALPFYSRHPWVFESAIGRVDGRVESVDPSTPGSVGELITPPQDEVGPQDEVAVCSTEGKFIARGLFNPRSRIRVRLYAWEERPLDADFWRERISAAVAYRKLVFGDTPAWRACRLINSEADGLSGLTVDRYGDWLSLQWTSRALARREPEIVAALQAELAPAGIWRRTEKGIGELEGLEIRDGLISGAEPPRELVVAEHGLQIAVDIVAGHKTGHYFDQRDNRRAAAALAQGRSVLDLFCYTGGFALAAAAAGATHVRAVDSSRSALERGMRNLELNAGHLATLGQVGRVEFVEADCFRELERARDAGEKYGLIVLDPPKMARTQAALERAMRGYISLNQLALGVLEPGGVLVSCSCTGLVDDGTFLNILSQAGLAARRTLRIIEFRHAAPDHPLAPTCPENAYLKCVIAHAE